MNDALLALFHPSVPDTCYGFEKLKGCDAAFEAAESDVYHQY